MKAIIATVVYYGIMMMEIMLFSAEALPIEKSAPVYFSCFLSNVFFSIFFSFSFFFVVILHDLALLGESSIMKETFMRKLLVNCAPKASPPSLQSLRN